jgi:predicted nucleic acid-binding protein
MEWFIWGNPNYGQYFEDIQSSKSSYVSEITLIELYHHIYHNEGLEIADTIYSSVINHLNIAKLDHHIIKNAGILRSTMLKEKRALSYADCVNYTFAKNLGLKLLTGDEDFRGMDNVEFMK